MESKDEIKKTKKDLERIESCKSNLQDNYMGGTITPQDYQVMKDRVDKDLALIRNIFNHLQEQNSSFKSYIENEAPMLEDLLEYYSKSDGATKKKILGCIFAEKLFLEKGKVATIQTKNHIPDPMN